MSLAVRLAPIRLPLIEAVPTGHGAIRHRDGLLVGLDDGEQTGWGETSPLPGWMRYSLTETRRALQAAVDGIRDDRDVAAAIASLHQHPHARAGLSGAWADLRARRERVPLAAALSGRWRLQVPVNALLGGVDVDELEREAGAALAQGFTTLKLKVGVTGPDVDVERVRAVREAAPDAALRLDANQAWDRTTAVHVLRHVERFEIAYCEEPTAFLDEFASVGAESGVPVAVDESVVSETDLRRALAAQLTTVIVKPQAVGGPDRAAVMTALVEEAGGTAVVTSLLDSAVGVAHALHFASAFGSPVAHGLATTSRLATDVGPAPVVAGGHMHVPTAPGIGFDPEPPADDQLRPHLV